MYEFCECFFVVIRRIVGFMVLYIYEFLALRGCDCRRCGVSLICYVFCSGSGREMLGLGWAAISS